MPNVPEEIQFVERFGPLAHTELLLLASFSGQGRTLNQSVKRPTSLFALIELSR